MGYGGYSHEAHEAITTRQESLPVEKVFVQTSTHGQMSPLNVGVREARDSATHPDSIGVFLTLDVTGSMGTIPPLLAQKAFPNFMRTLIHLGVLHPQVLFAAVGDAHGDVSPLQVGQFESEATLMNHWLTSVHIEGGGGGRNHGSIGNCESYDLPMYFAARHTVMDCFEKRSRKGYFIMTGDEQPYPYLERHLVKAIIGDTIEADIPIRAVVNELIQSFHPFFIIPDAQRASRCERAWMDLIGDHVIVAHDPEDIVYIAAALIGLTENKVSDLDELRKSLSLLGVSDVQRNRISHALTPYADTLGAASVPEPSMSRVQ